MKTPVSVIGLGLMGTALARAFLRNGHPTTVWNRSGAKAAPLVREGAARAASPREAVTASRLTVVCLSIYDNVEEVLKEAGTAQEGRVIVNLTNGTPDQARAMAGLVGGQGGVYLDGGIMAVPPMIGGPGALIFYSGGSQDAFEEHAAALGVLAEARYLGGDPGLASLYDLALLSAMYGMFGGLYQALALVRTENISAREFTPLVTAWLTAMMDGFPEQAEALDTGRYATEVSSLANNRAGYPNLIAAAREQGVGTTLLDPFAALLEQAVTEGRGEDGLARLVEYIARP
ncbi:NAD(P)-dependent oxidoreductase [Spirillospora sp. CA-294931]|uniref:NAD(P)-dependent oxidoreductase n=1 Tax=Spirillospora sp. CA-294931 TaxID=3240042 RepID=UPI003D8BCCD7